MARLRTRTTHDETNTMGTIHRTLLLPALAGAFLFAACSDDDDDKPTPTITAALPVLGLDTLATAVAAAGLDGDLAGTGPFTLYAPTDAAFAALPDGVLDSLLLPQNQQALIDVLLYHVVPDAVSIADAAAMESDTTLSGPDILIDTLDAELYINNARVLDGDNVASNGIIHTIDQVLLPPADIFATLTGRGFETLTMAITAADLETTLTAPGDYTLLAPTDAAFVALGQVTVDFLLDPINQAELQAVLGYHLINQRATASDALTVELVETSQGQNVLFSFEAGQLRVNGIPITHFNIPCTNGIIHVVDTVIEAPVTIAQTAVAAGLSTLVTALDAAGLTATFADAAAGPFTVFAPTNAAFDALPAGVLNQLLDPINQPVLIDVLQYHVVLTEYTAAGVVAASGTGLTTLEGSSLTIATGGGDVTVDGNTLGSLNVLASNGIIHTIGGVLLPPGAIAALQ